MMDRSVTLVAGAEVAVEGGLRLPPGHYRAVKRRFGAPTPSKRQFLDLQYLIELSGKQIVAMGGTPGAAGLISAEVDVSRQVYEGILRLGDRQPAPLVREPFDVEYRPIGITLGTVELRRQDVLKLTGRTWERVKSDLADCLRLVLREIKAAPLPFPSGQAINSDASSAGRLRPISWSIRGALQMTTDGVSVLVVLLFALFAGAVSYIIRPRNRRQSRRPVALNAATDSPDPLFVDRRGSSRFGRLRDFFLRRRH
jgi:hypothetical protein